MADPIRADRLFTVILEFDGVNSVSQFVTKTLEEALRAWRLGLDDAARYGLKSSSASDLKKQLNDDWQEHVKELSTASGESFIRTLNETTNVWCVWLSIRNKTALINIVATLRQRLPPLPRRAGVPWRAK